MRIAGLPPLIKKLVGRRCLKGNVLLQARLKKRRISAQRNLRPAGSQLRPRRCGALVALLSLLHRHLQSNLLLSVCLSKVALGLSVMTAPVTSPVDVSQKMSVLVLVPAPVVVLVAVNCHFYRR